MKTQLTAAALATILALVACAPKPAPQATNAPTPPTQSTAQLAPDSRVFRDCADCPAMVRIPSGSFEMGSPQDEPGRQIDEGPIHRVVIAKPFALSAFEISSGEYRHFVESTGRTGINWKTYYTWHTVDVPNPLTNFDAYPAADVTWQDAKDFAAWLSQRTGKHYRLPTEAEWEYAARAGDSGARFEPATARQPTLGSQPDSIGNIYPADAFGANAYGLHGMTSNMGEWIEDCYLDSYDNAPTDGSAVEGTCKKRVTRGASNYFGDDYGRIANRSWDYAATPGNGIRLARDLP
jgi:formylglycine-generating enzyme required for sulfatase activity